MASNEQSDDRELEVIRGEMERKREALAEKIGALESQVVGTVQTATDAVSGVADVVTSVKETITDTTDAVKEAVSSTVQSVGEVLNVSRHVENYPWASVGCAFAAGFAGGVLLGGPSRDARTAAEAGDFRGLHAYAGEPPPARAEAPPAEEDKEGLGSQLFDSLGEAWQRMSGGLQGLAVGAVMGLVREMASRSLPDSMVPDIGRFIDDVRDKLGGKVTDMSRSVVDYVKDAMGSGDEGEQGQPAPAQAEPPAPEARLTPPPAPRQQPRNGPRHRAGSR